MKSSLQVSETDVHELNQVSQKRGNEEVEVQIVAVAHTIVYPGAVVVKSFNAPLAHAAMPAVICFDQLALSAEVMRLEMSDDGCEVKLLTLLDITRVSGPGKDKEKCCNHYVGCQK